MRLRFTLAACVLVFLASTGVVSRSADSPAGGSPMVSVSPQGWRWEPIPQMKPGAERVILRQDSSTGAVELLARYPEGYVVPWHWHTANERLVVLEGRFRIESADHEAELARGGFVYQPGKNVHQVSCVAGPCMYYAFWDGKWDINYVDPPKGR